MKFSNCLMHTGPFICGLICIASTGHAQEITQSPNPAAIAAVTNTPADATALTSNEGKEDLRFSYFSAGRAFASAAGTSNILSQDVMGDWYNTGTAVNPLDVELGNATTDGVGFSPNGTWGSGKDMSFSIMNYDVSEDGLGYKNLIYTFKYKTINDGTVSIGTAAKVAQASGSSIFVNFVPGKDDKGKIVECRLIRKSSMLICATTYVDARIKRFAGAPVTPMYYDIYVREKNLAPLAH